LKEQTQHFDVLKRDLIINILYYLFTMCTKNTNATHLIMMKNDNELLNYLMYLRVELAY